LSFVIIVDHHAFILGFIFVLAVLGSTESRKKNQNIYQNENKQEMYERPVLNNCNDVVNPSE